MAEGWGAILRGLGAALSAIYDVIPSYGVAIILLTVAVRVLLIPLTIKQIRSMSAMQKLQPELKKLQAKHKGDRQKLNEEMMKLYREHGVNPLGGCFPLVMQAPVFIALYSVLRAAIPSTAALPAPEPADLLLERNTICIPVASSGGPTAVECTPENGTPRILTVESWRDRFGQEIAPPRFATRCQVVSEGQEGSKVITGFTCTSPIGTGHLPRESDLFGDLVADRAGFLGMELACSPTQAGGKVTIRQCASKETKGGGLPLVGYYGLVLLMMASTYYQQKQMQSQVTGPQAAQMRMMTRIMPLFLGFISLNIPAGVIIYWVASNLWTIGQQSVFLRAKPGGKDSGGKDSGGKDSGGKDSGKPPPPAGRRNGSDPGRNRRKKKKKKRR